MFFTAFPSGSLIHHYIFHKCSIFRQISGWDGLHWRPPSPKSGGGRVPLPPPWFTPLRRFNEKLEPCVHIPYVSSVSVLAIFFDWYDAAELQQLYGLPAPFLYVWPWRKIHHRWTDKTDEQTVWRSLNSQTDRLRSGEQIKFMELTPLSASADVTGIVWMQR